MYIGFENHVSLAENGYFHVNIRPIRGTHIPVITDTLNGLTKSNAFMRSGWSGAHIDISHGQQRTPKLLIRFKFGFG